MTAETPVFSVIMATWGRGRHILPSIQSVLGQEFRDFELIVVGDACSDETGDVVAGLSDPRVRWINLANRCGSQSAPNNAGIAAARGAFIAYLGHDDIWEMGHLAELARVFGRSDAPDFAVSGLIAHLPQGVPGSAVMGLFSDDSAKHRYFFPPSCFAHRKSVIDRIGPWLMPMEVRAPVDADLLLRASAADLRFASTGVVTVHKFTAMLRYLSYLQPASDEQEAMLADLSAPDHAARMAAIVDTSRRMGRFMLEARESHDHLQPGELARISAARRGVTMAARPLVAGSGHPPARGKLLAGLADQAALRDSLSIAQPKAPVCAAVHGGGPDFPDNPRRASRPAGVWPVAAVVQRRTGDCPAHRSGPRALGLDGALRGRDQASSRPALGSGIPAGPFASSERQALPHQKRLWNRQALAAASGPMILRFATGPGIEV